MPIPKKIIRIFEGIKTDAKSGVNVGKVYKKASKIRGDAKAGLKPRF